MHRIYTIVLLISLFAVHNGFAQCTANAGANVTICSGESVTIGGNPAGTGSDPLSYSWSNGAGDVANPTVSPTSTTTYTITVTDDNGCTDQDNMTVTVLPSPEVVVNFSQPDDCSSTAVQFTSNVSGCNDCSYFWDFDNEASGTQNTSAQPNPSHIFVSTGSGEETFDVSLTITASNGCTATQTVQVVGQQSPQASLTEDSDFTQCLGIAEFYAYVTDESSPAANNNYHIDWGDGTAPYDSNIPPNGLEHIYSGLNIWTLTYTVTGSNGCTDVQTYEVSNITNPAIGAATLGNTQQCGPVEMCFDLNGYSNNHASTSYTVNFGDGSPPEVFAHPPPAQVCHTYTTSSCPDSYTFSIVANNNCTPSTVTISPIQIFTPPQALFSNPPAACVNSDVFFENLSYGGFNQNCSENANYLWDFGDPASGANNTSTAEDGTHVYSQPGTYTVVLTASNAGNPLLSCGSTTYEQTICIEPPPEPDFSIPNEGCVSFSAIATNTSGINDACDITTFWEVEYFDAPCAPNSGAFQYSGGTGQGSDEPQFSFQSAGDYTVQLNLQNTCGTFSETETITVNTIPTVEIDPIDNICPGESIFPQAEVDGCNSPVSNYSWSFPGGNPVSAGTLNPGEISYANPGDYTATLTVTNGCGSATSSVSFTVENAASINVTATESTICSGQSSELTASGANSYTWDSAPGLSTYTGAVTTASPTATTTYSVTGATSAGCTSSTDITINVNPLPVVNIPTPESICLGESVQLNPLINGGSPPYQTYTWTPSEGLNQDNILNPVASPESTTEYSLLVTDSEGCQSQTEVTVAVEPLPIVEAGPDITICNQPIPEMLTGFSPTTGGNGVWSGDGITNAVTGEFTPPGVGTFTLTYTFTSSTTGCSESDDLEVTVIEATDADAGPNHEVCQNSPEFPLVPNTPGGSWSGDDVTSEGVFTPAQVQTYTITYSLGGGSCLTTDEIEIVVNPLPVVDAGLDVAICDGESTGLNGEVASGTPPYSEYSWSPALWLSNTDVLDPIATPANDEVYTLTVTDANGCESSDEVEITVNPLPVVDAGSDIILCDQPQPVLLEGYSPAGGTWSGEGITNSTTGEFTPNGEGSFVVVYEFTDANGCTNSDDITVQVTGLTQADAGNDFSLCLNAQEVQLADAGQWSGPHVTSEGIFTPSESGVFTITYTTGVGTCQTSDQAEVTVFDLPNADAGSDQTICIEDSITVIGTGNTSNPPITSYVWSGPFIEDDGNGEILVSPETNTTYTLTVTDSEGCTGSDEMTVSVNLLPEVDAGPDVVLCNQPFAFNFSEFTPDGGEWSGIGVTDVTSGEYTPSGTGVFEVTYTYTDANGCTNSDDLSVQVDDPVVVEAGPDLILCLNEPEYQLLDFVPVTGGTWIGDGIIENSEGVFDAGEAGEGDHVLLLQNGEGTCFSEDSLVITVLGLPVIDAGVDEVFCGNEGIVQLGVFSPAGGVWIGEGVVNSPEGTFDTDVGPGVFEIAYAYTDPITGCADTTIKLVDISPLPVADFSINAEACTNSALEINNNSLGNNSYLWDFGNGDSSFVAEPNYTYPETGNYEVTLTATNDFGCAVYVTQEVEAIDPPVAGFTLPVNEGCAPLEVFFENTSQGDYLNYDWDLGTEFSNDYEPSSVTYQQGDSTISYPISLTATNYCGVDVVESEVTVYPTPVVLFGTNLDVLCSPFTVEFNNLTVGEPTSVLWDFGDGTTSDSFNVPPQTYTTDDEPSEFTITLTATNDCGTDSQEHTITVLPNTVTAFFNTDISFGCAPLEVQFTDFSTGATEFYYSFGDALNSGSNEANPTFTYTEPGIYTAQLFADNNCSYDTASVQIEVFETPELTFTYDGNRCEGNLVQFINTSFDSDDFTWDFGDGTTSSETSPAHIYETAGVYEVTLTGQSLNDECPGFGEQTIEIYAAPEPSFIVPDQVGCSPFTVQFNNTTIGGDFYEWDFGEGNTAGIINPEHTFYNDTGESILYPVTLTATNTQLCSAEFTYNIIVSPTPIADFVLSEYETCEMPFIVESANLSQFANNYDWTWQAGGSTVLAPDMTFSETGTHEVSLMASNSFGCSDVAVQYVTIFPKPEVLFEPSITESCPPLNTEFINLTTNADNYFWTFSSGDTSLAVAPVISFTQPGSYHATLVASNEFGCVDTLVYSDVVTVFPVPNANFSFSPENPTSQDLTFELQNQTIGGYNYFWNTGDAQTSFQQNPTFTFPEGGTYPVQLSAQNIYGCIDYITLNIVIPEDFFIYVPNAFTPDHDGINEDFKPIVGGSNILNYTFQIFNRWGEILFETNDRNEAWRGDVRGGNYYVEEEVYVWQVLVRYLSNGDVQKERFRGHVTVLR